MRTRNHFAARFARQRLRTIPTFDPLLLLRQKRKTWQPSRSSTMAKGRSFLIQSHVQGTHSQQGELDTSVSSRIRFPTTFGIPKTSRRASPGPERIGRAIGGSPALSAQRPSVVQMRSFVRTLQRTAVFGSLTITNPYAAWFVVLVPFRTLTLACCESAHQFTS